jgi:hypothetical protein
VGGGANGVGGEGKKSKVGNGDAAKQSLGALSGLWGMERKALPHTVWHTLGSNSVDSSMRGGMGGGVCTPLHQKQEGPPVNKRLKRVEDDAGCAASSASTTMGGPD